MTKPLPPHKLTRRALFKRQDRAAKSVSNSELGRMLKNKAAGAPKNKYSISYHASDTQKRVPASQAKAAIKAHQDTQGQRLVPSKAPRKK